MFNILYRCPRTVARHENGPLHESRRRYLEHLSAQGAALHTLRGAAGIIYRAAIWMKLDESSPVERKEVERAAIPSIEAPLQMKGMWVAEFPGKPLPPSELSRARCPGLPTTTSS
jgi:hypothetical protein